MTYRRSYMIILTEFGPILGSSRRLALELSPLCQTPWTNVSLTRLSAALPLKLLELQ